MGDQRTKYCQMGINDFKTPGLVSLAVRQNGLIHFYVLKPLAVVAQNTYP